MGRRGTARPSLALVAAFTTWVTMLSWRGFSTVPGAYLAPLLLTGLVVAGTGILGRRLHQSGPVVLGAQVLAGLGFVLLSLTGSPVPVGERWTLLVDSLHDAVRTAQTYTAPVPASAPGLHPMLLLLGLGCFLLVDLAACTVRRVPAAGLVLLTIYSIPVNVLGGGVSWWVFAAAAGGFLGMLFLQEDEEVSRWGRTLGQEDAAGGDPSAFGVRTGSGVRTSAVGIGGAATVLALLLPALVPTLELGLLPGGSGPGSGTLGLENPMVDLRRDMQRGQDVPLLRVTTDDPHPAYLRIAALTRFTNNEWTTGDRSIPADQRIGGALPPLLGVSESVPRREYDYQVTALDDFDSRWLPATLQTSRIDAVGDWRYDRSTMDFLAHGDETSTSGLSYSMTEVVLDLDAARLAVAPAAVGTVERFQALPADLPRSVRDLAVEVTAGQPTRYQRAVALQEWFRSDFTYVLDAVEGNGSDALLAFLDDRTGYCEQFASAMAVMARSLGIPARVAVGFLRPERIGERTWEYSAWDLHAWPELYFPGSGWVRFEPTPASREGEVPAPGFTLQQVPQRPDLGASGPSATGPGEELPSRGTQAEPRTADASASARGEDGLPWRRLLLGSVAVVTVGLLLLVPRSVRRARSTARRTSGTAEDAWAEVRDTCLDLALPWPEGRSPRVTGGWLAGQLGRPGEDSEQRPARGAQVAPDAAAAVERLVAAVELSRYARPGTDLAGADLRSDVETCRKALVAGATPRVRRRATWLPRSVLRRATGRPTSPSRYDGVVDQVG
ncbi:DUF3488 and transglutaminase-like domain-containing protein [Nocardioides sp.]|uniref:transglutaminase family protein n=1 Tax=Nocardioides sp. TaxID=35761 RepID=UPI002D1FBE19|nr:DUF3488 and transglutaminase-like domain-containing protein [Nocardioides sp.]